MFMSKSGRHFNFAKKLKEKGYEPTIFCASTNHVTYSNMDLNSKLFEEGISTNIPFVFIDTIQYKKNDYRRILNMLKFYKNLFPVANDYAKKYGKPDVILASSVHPLTLVAGIKIAERFNVPCITEIRDLWPESLVAYNHIKKNNPITKLLYKNEKWIYKNSDSIIMTWEGGKQYIIDQGWEDSINLEKVYHISNGIILDDFDENSNSYIHKDVDLEDNKYKNIVYTGSVRKVNNLGIILDAAKIIQNKNKKIRFLIYGSGNEEDFLKQRIQNENINNVIFKGWVEKKYIPSILKRSYANLLHNSSTMLNKYGQSQNKLFEYLAAGKCIIQTYKTGYSVIEKYNSGVSAENQSPEIIANMILEICDDEENIKEKGDNARNNAVKHDFTYLTNELINIIEKVDK